VYVLKKEEAAATQPFFAGSPPQFYIRTTDVDRADHGLHPDDGTNVEDG